MLRTTTRLLTILISTVVLLMAPAVRADPPVVQQVADSYYSPQLRADFYLQTMTIPGFTFEGARIVGIQDDSPLRNLGLQHGDVITRLDGMPIGIGKYWVRTQMDGYWALPQMEKHFANTQVRYIRSGTTRVMNGWVDLGPLVAQPPVPPMPPPILPPVPPE